MAGNLELWRNRFGSPFREFAKLQSDFDRAFQDLTESRPSLAGMKEFSPSCEITEDKNNYLLKFDMPGVIKENVKIELDRHMLTVTAERREEKKSDDKKTHYSEISYGSFVRSFTLPAQVEEAKVLAKFEDGVLTVMLPKTEASQPKKISVN
jgi:HSP20 family protein